VEWRTRNAVSFWSAVNSSEITSRSMTGDRLKLSRVITLNWLNWEQGVGLSTEGIFGWREVMSCSGDGTNLKMGYTSGAKRRKNFLSCSCTFLTLELQVQLVVLVSAFVMVSNLHFGQFLVRCFSTHVAPPRALPSVKVGMCSPVSLCSRRH